MEQNIPVHYFPVDRNTEAVLSNPHVEVLVDNRDIPVDRLLAASRLSLIGGVRFMKVDSRYVQKKNWQTIKLH